MRYVDSGEGKLPLISLLAMLAVSLTVNLPGLAVSPIMDKLDKLFPHDSDLEFQMLTILPNLVIIPFILWGGKLSVKCNQMVLLGVGLGLYTLGAILCLFAGSMIELILLGCLIGAGCGLIVPLANGLIGEHFAGDEKTKQLGVCSGISNFMVIVGTLFVGCMAGIEWHLAFLVYLVPIIPLVMIPFMTPSFIKKHSIPNVAAEMKAVNMENEDAGIPPMTAASVHKDVSSAPDVKPAANVNVKKTMEHVGILLVGIMGLYVLMTYACEVVSYYTPFAMQHYHYNSTDVGVATAMFFLSATLGGFGLPYALRLLKKHTNQVAILLMVIGLYMTALIHNMTGFCAGTFIMGLGYGIAQPIIYDKTSILAPTKKKTTQYFSYVQTSNYVAIVLVPFVVNLLAKIFNTQSVNFPFWLNGSVMVGVLIWAFVKRDSFIFKTDR